MELASRRMPRVKATQLRELYKRVKGEFNGLVGDEMKCLFVCLFVSGAYKKYMDLVGGAIGIDACATLRRGNKIFSIDDKTPLIHFLSDSEVRGWTWL